MGGWCEGLKTTKKGDDIMKHFIGIDISKQDFHFCVLNKDGKIVFSGSYPACCEGFTKFLNLLKSLTEPVVVMESSGRYHIPLYSFLISKDIETYVINPKVVHRFFKFISANNPSKNDKKDAKVIALFALTNPHMLNSSTSANTRKLAHLIQKLKCELSSTKTQIKYALSVLFPEAERYLNIYCHSFLHVLLKYPSAKRIRNAKLKDISKIIKDCSIRGRKPSFQPQHLIELAENSIGVDDPYFAEELIFYIEKLFFLEPRIQRLEKMLVDEIDKHQHEQIKLISSIKGISEKLAALFLAEVKDIKNFSNHKKLIKYAGTDPVIKESGNYKLRMSISKQGSPFLRNVLFQMAVGVVKWNSCFREYFLHKKEQFGSYKKAMVALMNKLIRVIYAICTKGKPFRAELVKPMCPAQVIHV